MRQISIVVGALLLVAAALLAARGRFPNELASTQEGALLALSYLKESLHGQLLGRRLWA